MAAPRIAAGVVLGTQPPLIRTRIMLGAARIAGLRSAWVVDHFQGWFPEGIWGPELTWLAASDASPNAYFDWQVLLGRLAASSGRVRLGVGVTEPVRRHPVLLAQAIMTVAHATRRPPILGIGAGERENLEPYGFELRRPVARLEEALQIIRTCFHSRGPLEFEGEFFRLRGGPMDLGPPPGRVPEIWMGAHGPRMLDLTGRYADGWYPAYPLTPEQYDTAMGSIRTAAVAAGRRPDAVTGAAQLYLILGRTSREARDKLDHPAIRFLALLVSAAVWRSWGLTHPFGPDYNGIVDFVPQERTGEEVRQAMADVPMAAVERVALVGTPNEVLAKIRALGEAGLRHAVLVPASAVVSKRDAAWAVPQTLLIGRRLQSGR